MLLPLALRDLLHDGTSQSSKQLEANQFFQSLKIGLLHLIFVVLVEDMPLELIQCLICIAAHLARVVFADLDPHVLSTFKSTAFDVLLGIPLSLKRLLTAWALHVIRSIFVRMVHSLLPECLFTSSSVLRLLGVH